MGAGKKRQLNYELLRILAMLMIVCLHYLSKGGLLGDPSSYGIYSVACGGAVSRGGQCLCADQRLLWGRFAGKPDCRKAADVLGGDAKAAQNMEAGLFLFNALWLWGDCLWGAGI